MLPEATCMRTHYRHTDLTWAGAFLSLDLVLVQTAFILRFCCLYHFYICVTALAGKFNYLFGFARADYPPKVCVYVRVCVCVCSHVRGINTAGCDVSGLLKRKWCRPASARNHVFCSSEPKTHTQRLHKHTQAHVVPLCEDKSLLLPCLFV